MWTKRSADAALSATRRTYPPDNRDGVVAFDVGPRAADGDLRDRPHTIRLFVARSAARGARDATGRALDATGRALGATIRFRCDGAAYAIRPEVVVVDREPAAATGVATQRFTGIHAGAAILVHDTGERWGGVGCVVRGGDATYIVTAGHLFTRGRGGVVRCAKPGDGAEDIGQVTANLLDGASPAGAVDPHDAALVRLDARGIALLTALPGQRSPRLTGLLDPDAITPGTLGQSFQPTTNDYSAPAACSIDGRVVYLPADARPARVAVSHAIRTATPISAFGDSGTILCTADAERLAMGICIGTDGGGSLFAPLAPVLDAFSAQLGVALTLLP